MRDIVTKEITSTIDKNAFDIKKILENIKQNIKQNTEILNKNKSIGYSKYCNYCGSMYDSDKWPKTCKCCSNTTFRNPIPVAVGLLPFVSNTQTNGLLLIQRAIKPFVGEFCLPGGFVDWGESWEEAVSREILEETNIKTDPDEFEFTRMISTPDKTRQLFFWTSRIIRNEKNLKLFKPNEEVSNILIANKGTKLCFSLHQEVFDNYFKE